jgi:hypothetical protein
MNVRTRIAPSYVPGVVLSAAAQALLLWLSCFCMDGGQSMQFVIAALFVYWCTVLMIVFRRPTTPTKGDLWLVTYGFFFFLVVVPFCMIGGWILRGVW